MKQIGYIILFLMFVIIVIPFILVRGCSTKDISIEDEKAYEKIHKIKVYIAQEEKVVEMTFDEYLKGVVAAEMPASFHLEALKAQAVAARTYVYHRVDRQLKLGINDPDHHGADICTDSAHCKAWISKQEAMDRWGLLSSKKYWNKISQAVEETANVIATYQDEPIDAVFHSTSSGRTENSEDVWSNIIPYLRSKESLGEEQSPKYITQNEITIEEFTNKLQAIRPEIIIGDNIKNDIQINERTEGGSVKDITIGGQQFEGTELRKIFALNSSNFAIDINENHITFNVKGYGHGVGMSQYGANYLAEQGLSYQEILYYYYTDINIVSMEEE